jgi:hypothetical protein
VARSAAAAQKAAAQKASVKRMQRVRSVGLTLALRAGRLLLFGTLALRAGRLLLLGTLALQASPFPRSCTTQPT